MVWLYKRSIHQKGSNSIVILLCKYSARDSNWIVSAVNSRYNLSTLSSSKAITTRQIVGLIGLGLFDIIDTGSECINLSDYGEAQVKVQDKYDIVGNVYIRKDTKLRVYIVTSDYDRLIIRRYKDFSARSYDPLWLYNTINKLEVDALIHNHLIHKNGEYVDSIEYSYNTIYRRE